jgi:hypothetical protein
MIHMNTKHIFLAVHDFLLHGISTFTRTFTNTFYLSVLFEFEMVMERYWILGDEKRLKRDWS